MELFWEGISYYCSQSLGRLIWQPHVLGIEWEKTDTAETVLGSIRSVKRLLVVTGLYVVKLETGK